MRSDDAELQSLLEAHLPSRERASGLVESLLQNLSWFFQPVSREQVVGELIPKAYRSAKEKMDVYDLGLLYMVFAVGAAADLTLTPFNQEGECYRHLARAALSVKSIFDAITLSAIQAVALMGSYEVVSGRRNGPDYGWKMMNLSMGLSSSVRRKIFIW